MKLTKNSKRLNIFAFFDKDGIVDDYVVYLLMQMRLFCDTQIVVVNGKLDSEGEAKISSHCDKIIFRDNVGYDITAYKEGFLQAEKIETYDEVLFFNQSVFGPICPLDEMFNEMGARDLDFWGMTTHKGARKASWGDNAPVSPHIQSYFFAVRKPMFTSEHFVSYWKNLPFIKNYWDAVDYHEVKFTEKFATYGYKWETYADTKVHERFNDYHLMGMPRLLLDRGFPFVKRKSFIMDRHIYSTVLQGNAASEIYAFIRDNTDYPLDYITKNLLRTCDITTITNALVPFFNTDNEAKTSDKKIVVVLWFSGEFRGEILRKAALEYSGHFEVFCVYTSEQQKNKFAPNLPKTHSFVTEKNGFSFIIGDLHKSISKFDFILYLNDKLPLLLKEFCDATTLLTAIECLKPYECASIMENNPRFGLLLPPAPTHQECFVAGTHFCSVRDEIAEVLNEKSIKVPLFDDEAAVFTKGNMFFARTEVINALVGAKIKREFYDGQDPPSDYLAPIIAQAAGYLTGYALTSKQAFLHLQNRETSLRRTVAKWRTKKMSRIDTVEFRMDAILHFYYERRHQMTLEQAFNTKLSLKQKLWIIVQLFIKPESFKKMRKNKSSPEIPKDELE